jgi:hypothetical protein
MAVLTDTNQINYPFYLDGKAFVKERETIVQNASRSAALAFGTLMQKDAANDKWAPLQSVAETAGSMLSGANGGNLAAWQAVEDGEFSVTVNGVALDITGLDFSGISALTEINDIVNAAAAGRFSVQDVDDAGGSFRFIAPTVGLYKSSVSVLSAVSGGSGTDISGASFFNATAGTVTAGTGGTPDGIYVGSGITAAAIVAGDVENVPIVHTGMGLVIDKNQLVLENSLALTDVILSTGKTIEDSLVDKGIIPKDSIGIDEYENA